MITLKKPFPIQLPFPTGTLRKDRSSLAIDVERRPDRIAAERTTPRRIRIYFPPVRMAPYTSGCIRDHYDTLEWFPTLGTVDQIFDHCMAPPDLEKGWQATPGFFRAWGALLTFPCGKGTLIKVDPDAVWPRSGFAHQPYVFFLSPKGLQGALRLRVTRCHHYDLDLAAIGEPGDWKDRPVIDDTPPPAKQSGGFTREQRPQHGYGPLEALQNERAYARRSAAFVLGNRGSVAPRPEIPVPVVLAALEAALDDEVAEVRVEAVKSLGNHGAKALPALLHALGDGAPGVRVEAQQSLRRLGPDAIPPILEALPAASPDYRESLLGALGEIGCASHGVLPVLLEALSDPRRRVREVAAQNLGKVGPGGGATVPALLDALRDTDWQVRHEAACGLRTLGPDALEAAPALVTRLGEDQVEQVRVSCARALGGIGSEETAAALKKPVETDQSRLVRAAADIALTRVLRA